MVRLTVVNITGILTQNKLTILSKGGQHHRKKVINIAGLGGQDGSEYTQSRISRLEHAEIDGDLRLSSLKKLAEALDMKFVYGFVPKSSLEDMVNEQAKKIALERVAKVSHTMSLEAQELSKEEEKRMLKDLIQKILVEQPKNFWDK